MTDDDIMDMIQDTPATIRMIARRFRRSEFTVMLHLKRLVIAGLVEEGHRRPSYEGSRGQPQKTYRLTRTKKVAA